MAMAKKDTAQIILKAAFAAIARKGCGAVSLRDIAEEAGVVLSQLNYHHKNKETLFSAVLLHMRQEYLSNVASQLSGCSSKREKISKLIRYNRHLLETNHALYKAFLDFFNLALWSVSFKKEMIQFMEEIRRILEENLHEAADLDPMAKQKSSSQAELILAVTFGVAMQYLMAPEKREILDGFDTLEQLMLSN